MSACKANWPSSKEHQSRRQALPFLSLQCTSGAPRMEIEGIAGEVLVIKKGGALSKEQSGQPSQRAFHGAVPFHQSLLSQCSCKMSCLGLLAASWAPGATPSAAARRQPGRSRNGQLLAARKSVQEPGSALQGRRRALSAAGRQDWRHSRGRCRQAGSTLFSVCMPQRLPSCIRPCSSRLLELETACRSTRRQRPALARHITPRNRRRGQRGG